MGSSGTGTFGDYTPTGQPRCDNRIDTALEEIAWCEFFSSQHAVPQPGAPLRLRNTPQSGRLMVEDVASGFAVGLLPTSYNYLIICFTRGYAYDGFVTASRTTPIPSIQISLVPVRS